MTEGVGEIVILLVGLAGVVLYTVWKSFHGQTVGRVDGQMQGDMWVPGAPVAITVKRLPSDDGASAEVELQIRRLLHVRVRGMDADTARSLAQALREAGAARRGVS